MAKKLCDWLSGGKKKALEISTAIEHMREEAEKFATAHAAARSRSWCMQKLVPPAT